MPLVPRGTWTAAFQVKRICLFDHSLAIRRAMPVAWVQIQWNVGTRDNPDFAISKATTVRKNAYPKL